MRAWVIGAVVALGGCIDAKLTLCGDGTACPGSLVCDQAHHSCVASDQLTACDGVSEGGACHTSALAGQCFDGVCLSPGCGNGVVEPGEQCDDGNRAGGDGCSQDCRSDERCGNGVADLALGETCDDGNLVSHDGCNSRCQGEAAAWRMFPVSLAGGFTRTPAFDIAHGTLVYPAHRTVWLWDGAAWNISPVLPPTVDTWLASTYDTDRSHVVSLALRGSAFVVLDWDGTQWIEISTTGTEPDSSVELFVYDPAQHAVMWISSSAYGVLSISGTTARWSDSTLLPFSLGTAAHAAFDASRQTVVVVDSDPGTWEWDHTAWTHTGGGPDGYAGHSLVYDPDRGQLLSIGGYGVGSNNASPEVLAWNGTDWTDTGARIPARALPTVWHDPAHHVIGVYGGVDGQARPLNDLAELAGTTITPRPLVQPVGTGSLAYDAANDRIVTIDGGATYTWDGAWHALGPASPASSSRLVFDPRRGTTLAFDYQNLKVFQLASDWQVLVANGPSASAFTYDYGRHGVVAISTTGAYLLPSDAATLSPIAPAPPDLPLSAAYDLGGERIAMLGNTGLADLVNGQWQPSLSPSGTYGVVSSLQTSSVLLVPEGDVDETVPIWERHADSFREVGTLPVAGTVGSVVERSRGRIEILMADGPAHVLLERQLVSALPDETCASGDDADGDGAMGCADPDCWATCGPACPLATSCP